MNYFEELKNSVSSGRSGKGKNALGKVAGPTPPEKGLARFTPRNVVLDIAPPSGKSRPDIALKKPDRPAREEFQTPPGRQAAATERAKPAPNKSEAAEKKESRITPPPVEKELTVRTWEPEGLRRRRIKQKIIIWGTPIAAAAVFIVATFLLPKFSITIVPKAETASVARSLITADTNLAKPNPAALRVPGVIVSVEKNLKQDYDTTGKKFIEERARGAVSIFNAYSSSPQALAASTRFQDPNGKIYRLVAATVIPGAKIIEGKIAPTSTNAALAADNPGEEYNIGAAELRIIGFRGTPKYEGFYAKAESGFGGGFRGEARVVTAEDLKRASEDLTRRAFAELKSELNGKIPSGADFISPSGGREITIAKIEQPKAEDKFDRFTVSVIAVGRLLIVRQSHVNEAVASKAIPQDSELSRNFSERQEKLVFDQARLDTKENEVPFYASGEFTYWRENNLSELKDTLRNSTPKKAAAYLRARKEIDSFAVKKFPAWLWYIPAKDGRFEVKIQPPA